MYGDNDRDSSTRPGASGTLSRLEPCAVKVASTVLRGRGGGNAAPLPDKSPTPIAVRGGSDHLGHLL